MLSCFAGELGALEEVVGQLVTRGLLKPNTLKALWLLCSNAFGQLTHVSTQHKQYLDWRSCMNRTLSVGPKDITQIFIRALGCPRHASKWVYAKETTGKACLMTRKHAVLRKSQPEFPRRNCPVQIVVLARIVGKTYKHHRRKQYIAESHAYTLKTLCFSCSLGCNCLWLLGSTQITRQYSTHVRMKKR